MDTVFSLNLLVFLFVVVTSSIPPEPCFAPFRADDCGLDPKPVIYYWKPGSRCEVGIWRGCLPNPNMFPDEYSCINTCIFVQRGDVQDNLDILKEPEEVKTTTEVTTTEAGGGNGTVGGNVTESGNGTVGNGTGGGVEPPPTTTAAPGA